MYKEGIYVRQSDTSYLQYLRIAANLGYANAEVELGDMYMRGNEKPHVSKNIEEGLVLYQKAAEKYNSEAILRLGCIYRDGLEGFVDPDPETGYQYIKAAAQTDNPRAWFEYGYVTLHGRGCNYDYAEAIRYISAAAEQDVPNAFKLMGDIYYNGYGMEVDATEAAKWYQKAVDADYGNAYASLGYMYLYGIGVTQNESKGFQLVKESADAGYADGYKLFGVCYENGMGTAKFISLAIQNYKKAADLGDNYARYRLYLLYRNGEDIAKDWTQSIQYLRKAADAGYSDALCALGGEYLIGELTHQEDSKAIEYITLAADAGNVHAAAFLGIIYYSAGEEYPVEKDYDKAYKYLCIAAANADDIDNKNLLGETYRDLGACYRFGRGTEVNHSLASYYTELAAEYGDASSFNAVKMLRNK